MNDIEAKIQYLGLLIEQAFQVDEQTLSLLETMNREIDSLRKRVKFLEELLVAPEA